MSYSLPNTLFDNDKLDHDSFDSYQFEVDRNEPQFHSQSHFQSQSCNNDQQHDSTLSTLPIKINSIPHSFSAASILPTLSQLNNILSATNFMSFSGQHQYHNPIHVTIGGDMEMAPI